MGSCSPDATWLVGISALGGSLVGGLGATIGTWWFDLRREHRDGKSAARVIYRELMHNYQALSTFRKAGGEWLSHPQDTAWIAYGGSLSRILPEDQWPKLASGYSIVGYWQGLSNDADASDILDETAGDIREAMVLLSKYLGVSEDELRRRFAVTETLREEGSADT